jgi:hypothetical protein
MSATGYPLVEFFKCCGKSTIMLPNTSSNTLLPKRLGKLIFGELYFVILLDMLFSFFKQVGPFVSPYYRRLNIENISTKLQMYKLFKNFF